MAIAGTFSHQPAVDIIRITAPVKFKGIDSGTGTYTIPGPIWESIGIETRAAVKTIPAIFVRSIPNIHTNFNSFTTEDNTFWLTWLALYLLAGWL